jgi:hypothetical protein
VATKKSVQNALYIRMLSINAFSYQIIIRLMNSENN